jgi:two-component system, LytTR family, response regulator
MIKISAVIVEDEKNSRELLKSIILSECPEINLVGEAQNIKEGVELVKQAKPQLLFLDISMPDGTGFDLLSQLGNQKMDIIFTTATDKFALKAIKYSAVDYLLKPLDTEELKAAVKKIVEKKDATPNIENLNFLISHLKQQDELFQKITLPTGNAFEVVSVKDIVRCEAEGSYTYFYISSGKKFMVSASLKHYEDLLPESDFIRVHHHHLINMNHVTRFLKQDGGYAIMSDGAQIEVSRRKKDNFLERLKP